MSSTWARRRAAGVCVRCGSPVPESQQSKAFCAACAEKNREANRKHAEALKRNEAKRCNPHTASYYAPNVAKVCLNCTEFRCKAPDRGCEEYREALKSRLDQEDEVHE